MCAKIADGIIIYKGDVKLQPCTKMDDWCFSIQTGVIMKKILVAVDSFKGSMTSLGAGECHRKRNKVHIAGCRDKGSSGGGWR